MSKQQDKSEQRFFSPSPYMIFGYVTIILTFGVFGTWAATAPLASGVVARGVVSVEGNRKTVQHLEGGIVTNIIVKEGDFVEEGDALLELDKTQALGNYAVWDTRMQSLRAQEARLIAESVGNDEIEFPEDLLASKTPEVEVMVRLQKNLFDDRQKTRDGKIAILKARIDQLNKAIEGYGNQLEAYDKQFQSMDEELKRLEEGKKKGVVATNQISRLQRNYFEVQSDRASIDAEISKSRETIAETELQIFQTEQEYVERAVNEYKDTRDQLGEVEEKARVTKNILDRTVIRAPINGKVQSLRIHTTSGVIKPADALLDIVPIDDDLIVNAQIRPIDIDNIHPDADVEVRFAAFSAKTTPAIFGKITVLSKDVIEAKNPNQEPFYRAFVKVEDEDIPDELKGRLVAGMPADVIVSTGERTLVEYLIKPLIDSFHKGMKEK